MMVCQQCQEWYHYRCIDKESIKEDISWFCMNSHHNTVFSLLLFYVSQFLLFYPFFFFFSYFMYHNFFLFHSS